MSGRPPLAGAGHDDNDDDGADGGYDEELDEEALAAAAAEEGEEHDNDGNGDDGDNRPDTSGSGVAVEFIPAPEERPIPPFYVLDLGGVIEYLSATSGSAAPAPASTTANNSNGGSKATSAAPTPQQGAFVAGLHKPPSEEDPDRQRNIHLSQDDPRIPKWLHYVLNDDFESLAYLVHPPPGAHIDMSGVHAGNTRTKSGDADGDDDDGGDGRDSRGSSRPTSSRGGGGGGGGDSAAGDSDAGHNAAAHNMNAEIEYHPNAKFTLVPDSEAPNKKWHLVPYEPPARKAGGNRPSSAMSDNDGASQYSRESGALSDTDKQRAGGNNNDEHDGDEHGEGGAAGRKTPEDEDACEPGTIVVDALTLAAAFSKRALRMMLKERMPAYIVPGSDAAAGGKAAGDDADDDAAADAAAARKRKQPPSLATWWRWCEAYGGLGETECACTPLNTFVQIAQQVQTDAEEDWQKAPAKKRPGAHGDNDNDNDDGGAAGGDDDDNDADGDAAATKQTEKQKRRLFLSYARHFDLVAAARTVTAAQQVESIMLTLLTACNVAPTDCINVRAALRNINTLQAYVTFLCAVPRSVVTAAWTEPVPLTEAEIAAYPEGSEDVPDEHPPKLQPRLWKAFEHIRRRAAAAAAGGTAMPKRPLLDVLKKLLTPSAEDLGITDEAFKPQPMIHTEPDNTGSSGSSSKGGYSDVQPGANVDPLLFAGFDAGRDYPPRQLRVYASDVVLAALCRHDWGAEAAAWLGGLKRNFPHAKWDPVGSSQVLAFSLNRMTERCALSAVSALLDPLWFAPCSRVGPLPAFLRDVVATGTPRCFDKGAFHSEAVQDYFAKHFLPAIVQRHAFAAASASAAASTSNAAVAGAAAFVAPKITKEAEEDAASMIVAKIEEACKPLAQRYTKHVVAGAAKFLQIVTSAKSGDDDLESKLDAVEKDAGRTVLATPHMLRVATDRRQLSAVHWLVQRGVARVEHERGAVPVLEYCVESSNDAVLLSLVERYADVRAPLLGGRASLLTAVQEQRGFAAEVVKKIEAAAAAARNWRGADPTQNLGIKLGSIVC